MLNIKIITVGRLKEKYLRDACGEYLKRLKRFGNVQVIELDEYRLSDNPSDREIEKALEIEGNNMLKEAKGYLIAMCIEGNSCPALSLRRKFHRSPLMDKVIFHLLSAVPLVLQKM